MEEWRRWRSKEWWSEGDVDRGGYDGNFDRFKLSLVLSFEVWIFAACPFWAPVRSSRVPGEPQLSALRFPLIILWGTQRKAAEDKHVDGRLPPLTSSHLQTHNFTASRRKYVSTPQVFNGQTASKTSICQGSGERQHPAGHWRYCNHWLSWGQHLRGRFALLCCDVCGWSGGRWLRPLQTARCSQVKQKKACWQAGQPLTCKLGTKCLQTGWSFLVCVQSLENP